ncbi:hypothetical protein F3Y22_tig00110450pilonHSYRG00571 [Hibiscus syriacus]|uniref:Uncharacterized protein n=1 Tax=Hibiscus syriacus TaxID=106335 RepID=A0A6A3AJ31_HIBSY|nr:hypothetical protein F3Y22_tig00110450pilonHSYRG00571 [Hibiscus syriacus]
MHFDQPEALENKYGGFLNHSIVNDFKDYAEICPPGRCSDRNFCPMVYGTADARYPESMRRLVKERLPVFTTQEQQLVKGSFDFIGGSAFIYVYPQGLYKVLKFMQENYCQNLTVYITENGYTERSNDSIPISEALKDELEWNLYRNIWINSKLKSTMT